MPFTFFQDELFAQPVRTVSHKHSTRAEKPLEQNFSRNVTNIDKPPSCKPAWTNQQTKEFTKKNIKPEKEMKLKSQRQRSYSEVENVEFLYSSAQAKDKQKAIDAKDKPSLTKSQSVDRLDSDNIQSRENISTDSSALSTFSDSNTASSRSKFTSRETVVKSQKPATKPLHLGECQLFPFRGFPPLIGLKFASEAPSIQEPV